MDIEYKHYRLWGGVLFMITQMHAQNFKSWKDTGNLRLAKLTGLFGTNSSGKTSILQVLLMLKQTAESPDRSRVLHTGDDKSLVDLGTFIDLIHNHSTNEQLSISFSWQVQELFFIHRGRSFIGAAPPLLFKINQLLFNSVIYEDSGRVIVDNFAYEFADYLFDELQNIFPKIRFGMSQDKKNKEYYNLIHDNYDAKLIEGRARYLPPPVKCYGFPDEAVGYYQNTGFLPSFTLEFEKLFSRINYLGPLRDYPKRSYIWAGDPPSDVGTRGEKAIAALLAARSRELKSGRGEGRSRRYKPIEDRIQEWMKKMGLVESLNLNLIAEGRKDYEVRVQKNKTSSEVLITDIGFGVSQILPILVLCYYVPEGSIILLEQPEIHLHPSVQAELADVLIDVVINRNVQIILESHSEHLLRRIQRRIAEESIPQDDVALYFCKIENGESKIDELDVDEYGNIRNWPQNFFGDEMGELVAMTEAAIKRKG
jgi:predicted ATPase